MLRSIFLVKRKDMDPTKGPSVRSYVHPSYCPTSHNFDAINLEVAHNKHEDIRKEARNGEVSDQSVACCLPRGVPEFQMFRNRAGNMRWI